MACILSRLNRFVAWGASRSILFLKFLHSASNAVFCCSNARAFAYWHSCVYSINEIVDLQRDLHANDFALCEEDTFGTRTLLFACKSARVSPSLNARGLLY